MNPSVSSQNNRRVVSGQSTDRIQAPSASRPTDTSSDLHDALNRLEEPGCSPKKRFLAWTMALNISLSEKNDECLAWLHHLHAHGEDGSQEIDASIALRELDLDTLEYAFAWLDRTGISLPVGIEQEADSIRANPSMLKLASLLLRDSHRIRSLKITGNGSSFEDEALRCLTQALEGNQSLRSLTLCSCGLDDSAMAQIGAALKGNRSIEELDFSYNSCGTSGYTAMACSLGNRRHLRALTLRGAAGDGGLAAIFESLKELGVEEIHLVSASYSQADAKALADLLTTSKSLKVLDLGHPSWNKACRDQRSSGAGRLHHKVRRKFQRARLGRWKLAEKEAISKDARTAKRVSTVMDIVFNAIGGNSTLTELCIRGWPLEAGHAHALGKMLSQPCSRLTKLKMGKVDNHEVYQAFVKAAMQSETLIELDVSPGVPDEVMKVIEGNRARLAPLALHTMFHRSGLPYLPKDVLELIRRQLNGKDVGNVIQLVAGLRPETD